MTKYIFLNVAAQGHINPTLAVVKELVERGEEVIYYLTEENRATIEATGATFRSYHSIIPEMQKQHSSQTVAEAGPQKNIPFMLPLRMAEEGEHVIPQLIESIRAEKPDYILYDTMCIWAKIIARSLHVPAILLRSSYAANRGLFEKKPGQAGVVLSPELIKKSNQKLAELCTTYGIEPFSIFELFTGSEALNITFIPREFQPGGESFDASSVFVGPSLQTRPYQGNFPLDQLDGKMVLYIALGTVFNHQIDFYKMCLEAFKDSPWQVVLSYGTRVNPEELGPIPANFIVAAQVPQLEVLARSSIFITHGGMNSTMESLYYGVPMLAFPQMQEQAMTARRIQELGLGLSLTQDNLSVETLRNSIERIAQDPAYKIRVQEMQIHVRNAGGYKKAADAIQQFADRQHLVTKPTV